MPTNNKLEWFGTCLGQYLLEREQNHFDRAVADVFGYHAMQVGFPQYDFLRANRMPLRFRISTEEGGRCARLRIFSRLNRTASIWCCCLIYSSSAPIRIRSCVRCNGCWCRKAMRSFAASTHVVYGACAGFSVQCMMIIHGEAISLRGRGSRIGSHCWILKLPKIVYAATCPPSARRNG